MAFPRSSQQQPRENSGSPQGGRRHCISLTFSQRCLHVQTNCCLRSPRLPSDKAEDMLQAECILLLFTVNMLFFCLWWLVGKDIKSRKSVGLFCSHGFTNKRETSLMAKFGVNCCNLSRDMFRSFHRLLVWLHPNTRPLCSGTVACIKNCCVNSMIVLLPPTI